MLIEAIKRLEYFGKLREYTYYGLGGPYLEDFRLLYEFCPDIRMVSIEENQETLKRQDFHRPCRALRLENANFTSFLAGYEARDQKSIFWLDYTRLEYQHFEDFMVLLSKVAVGSMVKVTLRAESGDFMREGKAEDFRKVFEAVMPDPSTDPPREFEKFAGLLQGMLQVAAQKSLPGAMPLMFQPVSSFYYADVSGMFTLTGVVIQRTRETETKRAFRRWDLANLEWGPPKRIDVPALSTKERLHLQRRLPCHRGAGSTLRRTLGYLIDENREKTESQLGQYAQFHRYFPYFMKAVP
jgi:hypothetical protein